MTQSISKLGAWAAGSAFVLVGAGILVGFQVLPANSYTLLAPAWILVCAGAVFIIAGILVINSYGLRNPNKLLSQILVLIMIISLFTILGWVAFGPGERHFTSLIGKNVAFDKGSPVSELRGRIEFGIAFFFLLIIFTIGIVSSIRNSGKK